MFNVSRLLIMMFLQYFTQGAWNMTIGAVLADYGMKNSIGSTYALLGLATLISPLFIGMIADRFLAAQKTIAILHLLNSVILYQIPSTILHNEYSQFFMLIFIVGLLYYPQPHFLIALHFSIYLTVEIFHSFVFLAILALLLPDLLWAISIFLTK